MKVVRLRLLLSGIFKYSAAQPIQPKFTDKRLFLPNAAPDRSARQALRQIYRQTISGNFHHNRRLSCIRKRTDQIFN